MRIAKNLRNYIKAEEKDTMHTVNHYSHVKATNEAEATRIHPHVIKHLKLCQQRMEQALEMLERYPDIESKVRPEIGEFVCLIVGGGWVGVVTDGVCWESEAVRGKVKQ